MRPLQIVFLVLGFIYFVGAARKPVEELGGLENDHEYGEWMLVDSHSHKLTTLMFTS